MIKYLSDYPELLAQWHPTKNGDIDPRTILAGSNKKYHFKCYDTKFNDHEWEATIYNRTKEKNPTSCPCCSNQKVVLSNCLATTHPDIAKQWHPDKNGDLTPYDVVAGCNLKVWFKCYDTEFDDHEWEAVIVSRTRKDNLAGCPCCNESKGEKRVAEYLEKLDLKYKRQYKHKKCKYKRLLPFDFIVRIGDKCGTLLEYHGEQHYELCTFGSKKLCPKQMLLEVQKRDKIKEYFCKNNNIPLLIIPYWEYENIEKIIYEFIESLK